jgi:energy-coupling factor transporter ATP-binding protein EcfA2
MVGTRRNMSDEDWQALAFEASQIFSPSTPLTESDLFAGRFPQIDKMFEATSERGKHVVLFGERGVGKTSLAKLFSNFFPKTLRHIIAVREQCDPTDDFSSIWKKVFKDIHVRMEENGETVTRPISETIKRDLTPDDIRRQLDGLFGPNQVPIIVIDEFDKVESPGANTLMANTIKSLSDYGINVTVILVGVADSIVELVGEHASVQRCIEQILMPRMDIKERKEVLAKIVPKLGMKMHPDADWKIADLSRGLPSYIHSLGLYAVQNAISRKSLQVLESDVDSAITRVLERSQETVREVYATAIHSNRADSLYREVLLACALAETNERGLFTPQAVCQPLTAILKRDRIVEIAAFQQHLKKFITSERGEVLVRKGRDRAFQFRFSDPMMQPFVIMKGIEQKLVDKKAMSVLSTPAQGVLPI